MPVEAEPLRGRGGQVVLAPADERAAVDDRDAHRAAAALERDPLPHGSDLCATPSVPAESVPPQASALPYSPGPYHDAYAAR